MGGAAARIQQWGDHDQEWLRETIGAHGWAVLAAPGDDGRLVPPLAHTIGLTRFGHSELVVFGLAVAQASEVLNRLGARACSGLALADGNRFAPHAIFDRALRLRRHPDPDQVVHDAVSRYGPRVCALQVLVADEYGTFPGEPGYRDPAWRQPEPGSFAA